MDRIPHKTQAKLFDRAVLPIQEEIANELPWIDHSIGVCEVLTEMKDGKKFTSANLFTDEYEQIMPCEELGNFCFWYMRDPQEIDRLNGRVKSPFSLIFWYNVDKVSSSPDYRNREAVKAQILAILDNIHTPGFEITRVYENPKNIFTDFSYDHVQNQFLMHPFGGIRIDGTIIATMDCYANGRFVGQGDFNEDYNEDYNK